MLLPAWVVLFLFDVFSFWEARCYETAAVESSVLTIIFVAALIDIVEKICDYRLKGGNESSVIVAVVD